MFYNIVIKAKELLEKFFKTEIKTLTKEVFKSLLVGGVGVIVNTTLFYLLTKSSIVSTSEILDKRDLVQKYIRIKEFLSIGIFKTFLIQIFIHLLLISISFLLQKYFTFQKKDNTLIQIKKFFIQSFFYFLLDTILTLLLYDVIKFPPLIAKGISVSILFSYSFVSQKLWVFKT